MDKMYDNSFMSIRKHRGDPAFQALNHAYDEMEDVKKWWNSQSVKTPESRVLAFKTFHEFENMDHVERWAYRMIMFQYIPESDTIIMNYNSPDGKIYPINFVRDGRVLTILWSWSQNPSALIQSPYSTQKIPYAIHKWHESKDVKIKCVNWETIYAIWSTLADPSRQFAESPGHQKIFETYNTMEEAEAAAK